MLIPCSDDLVDAVARLEPDLVARFRSSHASAQTLAAILDQGRFPETLGRLGIPHPRTVPIGTQNEAVVLGDPPYERGFLKPRHSLDFVTRFGVKAFRLGAPLEAITRVREARQAGLELLLQEYVPGPASHHYFIDGFVDRTGTVCGLFARQRLRMYSADFRDSSYLVSIPLEQVQPAVRSVERLLGALDYWGIFSAEFKYDDRDGLFKILEINTRPWINVDFAAACGVNVCAMAYHDALGLPVELVSDDLVGRYWIHPGGTSNSCGRGASKSASGSRPGSGRRRPCSRWTIPLPRWPMPLPTSSAISGADGRVGEPSALP